MRTRWGTNSWASLEFARRSSSDSETGVLEKASEGGAAVPRIDRRALGAIVFADPTARHTLEAIVHPAMRDRFLQTIDRLSREGGFDLVVLDAAILLEAGWDDLCDRIVFVDAPRLERLRRVTEARGWSQETLEARERAQWPFDEKRRRADWIITNESGPDRLQAEVDRLVSRLHRAGRLVRGIGSRSGSDLEPAPRSTRSAGKLTTLNVPVHAPAGRIS